MCVGGPEPLRLLVVVNPLAGKKDSEELYRKFALPIFEIAGAIIVEELITGMFIVSNCTVVSFGNQLR